jgi:hypothetical protein
LRRTRVRAIRREQRLGADSPQSNRQLIWEHFKDVLTLLGCEFFIAGILELAVRLFPDSLPLVQKCRNVLEWGAAATISYLIVESIVRMGLQYSLEMLRQMERSARSKENSK